MAFGSTPVSITVLSTNQFPASAVYVPNTSGGNFTALQGGPASSADSQGNVSAPVALYVADGNNVALGFSTDAAGANSVIGQLKQIRLNTASVTIGGGTVAATQSGSWTVTANIGTSGSLALDTSVNGLLVGQGSATSGEKGPLIQAAVTTGSPSYTTAQTSPLSLTTAGALRVDASATTQPVSGTFWQATQPVSAASLPLPSGAATSAKQPALGTAGTASADVITVQGIASMTALKVDGSGVVQPVSGTITANIGTTNGLVLDSSVNGILVSQGSTTSGEKGPLMQGAVTSSAPTYTTAQTSPISLTTAGAVRVDGSAVTQPVSGTVTANQGGSNWSMNIAQVAGGTASNAGQAGSLQVGGAVATNNNVSIATNPLLIAGSDYGGTPKVQTLKVDSSGNGQVAVTNTPSVAQSGTWTVQPGNTANTTPWLVQAITGTSGGSTPYHNVVSSGTNGTNVKASAGQVYDGIISNTSSSAVYFRFYDTSGTPTVGTTASKRTMQVPGNGTLPFSWPNGLKFTSGIAWGITTLIGDSDTTAISSSVSIDFGYD